MIEKYIDNDRFEYLIRKWLIYRYEHDMYDPIFEGTKIELLNDIRDYVAAGIPGDSTYRNLGRIPRTVNKLCTEIEKLHIEEIEIIKFKNRSRIKIVEV